MPAPAVRPRQPLPRTGFPFLPALPIGTALVVVGGLVVMARRRGILAPTARRTMSTVAVVAIAAGTLVCVRAYSDTAYGAAITAANGTYTISGLTSDVVVGFADCNAAPGHLVRTTAKLALQSGQARTGVDQVLPVAGFLSGTATPASGDVVPTGCAYVGLDSAGGESMLCLSEVSATGAYISDLLAPETYIVGFGAQGDGFPYAVVYSGNAGDPVSATGVAAQKGENAVPAVTLSPEGTVSGNVTEANGGDLQRCVRIYDRVNGVRTLASATADVRDYVIAQARPGANKIEFEDCAPSSQGRIRRSSTTARPTRARPAVVLGATLKRGAARYY